MADTILDVVTRLTYDVEDDELIAASNEVQKTISKITSLTTQLGKYEDKLKSTSRLEISERKKVQAEITRVKTAIDLQTKALENQIISNKKLQTAISQEIGLIGRLNAQMDVLKQKRDIANDPNKIRQYNRELAVTQARLSSLTGVGGKGILSGFGGAVLQGVGLGTGIGLVSQGIQEIKQFIQESSRLAAETEGVSIAFARLNRPDLLNNLRDATRGTVSDLELMKSAVQFSNFGLPVEKLSTALEFARIRAKETGQSVDFLVQSITTGIGRQSPLILDNLGINARRVREEFQRTGDFAQAAFNIIQEESRKAGNDLTSFAEKQARINAQIENAQAGFGKFFNQFQGGLFEFFKGVYDKDTTIAGFLFGEGLIKGIENVKAYTKALDEANKAQQRTFGIGSAFGRTAPRRKIDASNATLADVGNMTGEELDQLKEKVETARKILKATDTEKIDRFNKLSEAIAKQQAIIDGSAYKKAQTDNAKRLEEQAEKAKKLKQAYDELVKTLSRARELTMSETDLFKLAQSVSEKPDGVPFEKRSFIDVIDPITFDETEKKRKEEEDKIKDRNQRIIGYYQDAAQNIISTFQLIFDAKQSLLDAEIQITQARITAATELAKKGNTEVLDNELANLDKLQAEREKVAQKQLALNSLMQVSNAALALSGSIATIAGAGTTAGPAAPVVVAATVSALAAGFAIIAGLVNGLQGFKEGVIGFQGKGDETSDSNIVRISKGESVIRAEATKNNKAALEYINSGGIIDMPAIKTPVVYNNTNAIHVKGLEQRLDMLIAAHEGREVNVSQTMNENGLIQRVETISRRNKNHRK